MGDEATHETEHVIAEGAGAIVAASNDLTEAAARLEEQNRSNQAWTNLQSQMADLQAAVGRLEAKLEAPAAVAPETLEPEPMPAPVPARDRGKVWRIGGRRAT